MFGGGHAGVVGAQELDGERVAVSGVLNLCETCAAVVANVVGALVGNLGHAPRPRPWRVARFRV